MKEKPNLSDLEAAFVISSFKNKDRLNNPSSIPQALYPPGEVEGMEKQGQMTEGKEDASNASTVSNGLDTADAGITGSKPDDAGGTGAAGTSNASEEANASTNNAKRTTIRQRKAAFEEYRQLFLQTPKIVNRKPVFISESTRDRLNRIARKLGDDNMSASGFLENLALYHLEIYEEDIEIWRKL